MSETSAIDRLLAEPEPYSAIGAADDARFADAMAAADAWHRARNPRYARLWVGDTRPVLPVSLFKQVDLATPLEVDGTWLSSSGTSSGRGTAVYFDELTMRRIRAAMTQVFLAHRFFDMTPARFLLLSPDPARGTHPGYATTFEKFTGCAPVAERVFAVDDTGKLQPGVALEALRRWAPSPAPIFMFGLTVYFEQLALAIASPGSAGARSNAQRCGVSIEPLELAGSIRGLTGGGWKGLVQQLGRDQIVARLTAALRTPSLDLRDLFGLTEHPIHYISCTLGRFHVPKLARFTVVAADGSALPAGEPGLLRLQSPLIASLPSHDLLTEDRAAWGERCPCGSPLPFFVFLGRVAPATGTCAATAVGQ
jgi:hypothetical protein